MRNSTLKRDLRERFDVKNKTDLLENPWFFECLSHHVVLSCFHL